MKSCPNSTRFAGRFPWLVPCLALVVLCAPSADARNLLANPSAETGDLSGWTIIANGGSGWSAIYGGTVLSGGLDGMYVFATDHAWCRRSQTIDLLAAGYSAAQLDAAPAVTARQWFRGYSTRFNPVYDDTAYMRVELRNASGQAIAVYDSGEFTTSAAWEQKGATFTGYGAGLRYIYWEDGGLGKESYGPTDGPVMDAAVLSIAVDTGGSPQISVSPLSLDFGSVNRFGGQTNSLPVTVTNTGTADLEIFYGLVGVNSDDYVITSAATAPPIPPGGKWTIEVAFDPGAGGVQPGTLRIFSSDLNNPTTEVPLDGAGVEVPTCMSIARANPSPTRAASVDFTVRFSASVIGVDASDFVIDASGVSGTAVTGVSGTGDTWTVTVGTGTGTGSLSIDLIDNDSITAAGVPLGGTGAGNGNFLSGQAYAIDRIAPVITILGQNPAVALQGLAYSDAGATALDNVDGDVTGSIGVSSNVDTSTVGSYEVVYTAVDFAGNTRQAARTVVVAPRCVSINRASSNPTNAASVNFTVTFSGTVTGVDASDFVIDATGVSGASITGVSGSGATRTVSVATGTGDGRLSIDLIDNDSIVANGIALGGPGAGNGSFTNGQSFTIDKTRPVITVLGKNPVQVVRGEAYVDAGATALDSREGDITARIATTSNVDSSTVGTYQVTYNVSDNAGNAAVTKTRTVEVVFGNTRTFYVDGSYAGPEDGSSAKPFNTIAEGIAAAEAGRGDTVIVRAGVYAERVTLKDKLILIGERGAYHTHITGGGVNQVVVNLGAGSVLRGFSISGAGTSAGVRSPVGGAVTVTNCVLHSNGTGFLAQNNAAATFVNNAVYGNTTYGVRGGTGAVFTELKNNIFMSNAKAVSAGASALVDASHNCLHANTVNYEGPSGAPTDISANPQFVDAGDANFHLKASSPCRNAGDPAAKYNDLDGSRNDMGADGGPGGVRDTRAPTAAFSAAPTSGVAPLTVNFDASASGDEWGIQTYSWDFDGSDGIQQDATGVTTQAIYNVAGLFTATLTVTDNSGLSASVTRQITVTVPGDQPPTAAAAAAPLAGPAPLAVQFSGDGQDPDGGTVTYFWDFHSDGSATSTARNPAYTYPAGAPLGVRRATLTVTDDEGSRAQAIAYTTITQEPALAAAAVNPAGVSMVEVTTAGSPIRGTSVALPAGAFSEPVVLSLGWAADTPAAPSGAMSEVVEAGPVGLTLSHPAVVTIPLLTEPLLPEQLGVAAYDTVAGRWSAVGLSNLQYLDLPGGRFVVFEADHLSFFVVTYPAPTPDLNQDGFVNAVDVQICINAVLGRPQSLPYRTDLNGDGLTNAVDLQIVITAVLTG